MEVRSICTGVPVWTQLSVTASGSGWTAPGDHRRKQFPLQSRTNPSPLPTDTTASAAFSVVGAFAMWDILADISTDDLKNAFMPLQLGYGGFQNP